ncbi:hypothetical protein MHLP_04235 [Candidatus Mycoplasma haematolamae str. Purdue]|uniref:Uncharacterized protein n=1 Tax=Mycoplasma haematolamae (strain Purdue) TaxID=1212765 RepID=I7C785_MYCHA|nr:hypothetical protein [Candidatus Mycoplasma haematolamae]AFO52427.1 hypothetical protein MHLP_04235 [Candidatus Mycoplasma haematolamae str. Purdue]
MTRKTIAILASTSLGTGTASVATPLGIIYGGGGGTQPNLVHAETTSSAPQAAQEEAKTEDQAEQKDTTPLITQKQTQDSTVTRQAPAKPKQMSERPVAVNGVRDRGLKVLEIPKDEWTQTEVVRYGNLRPDRPKPYDPWADLLGTRYGGRITTSRSTGIKRFCLATNLFCR